jgi:hypothetical protein
MEHKTFFENPDLDEILMAHGCLDNVQKWNNILLEAWVTKNISLIDLCLTFYRE